MVTDASSLHLMQGRARSKGVTVGRLETATRRGESDRILKPLHPSDRSGGRMVTDASSLHLMQKLHTLHGVTVEDGHPARLSDRVVKPLHLSDSASDEFPRSRF
jgi:hypothetical protein